MNLRPRHEGHVSAPPPPHPPISPTPCARRCEFVEGDSSRFWVIARDGKSFTTSYDRIGCKGQTTHESFASAEQACAGADKQIAEKMKKGYRETTAG